MRREPLSRALTAHTAAIASLRAFQINRDLDFLWLGPRHRDVFDALRTAIVSGRTIAMLSGAAGSGKTMLVDAVATSLSTTEVIVGCLTHPSCDADDFWNAVAEAFRLGSGDAGVRDTVCSRFREVVQQAARSSTRVLLIVDEAQALADEVLVEVARASDVGAGTGALTIILVGDERLDVLLAKPEHAVCAERIEVRHRLPALDEAEVTSYIRHRLARVDAPVTLFTADSFRAIATISGGVPRLINVLCAQATARGTVVDRTLIEQCGRDLPWLVKSTIDPRARTMSHRSPVRQRWSFGRIAVVSLLGSSAAMIMVIWAGEHVSAQRRHTPSLTDRAPAAVHQPAPSRGPAAPGPNATETAPLVDTAGPATDPKPRRTETSAAEAKSPPRAAPPTVRRRSSRSAAPASPPASQGDAHDPGAVIDWLMNRDPAPPSR
jgi:general secretion pathway protein A